MDEYEMKRRIYGYIKEICHYSQMQVFATSYYQKNYFQMQIDDATSGLISLYMDLWKTPEPQRRSHNYHYQMNDIESYEQMLQPGNQEPQVNQPVPGLEQPISMPELPLPGEGPSIPLPEPSLPGEGSSVPLPEPSLPGTEQEPRGFTLEELAYYDGSNGKPAYVAVKGNVYDLSSVVRWAGGKHFGMQAGKDLSIPFMGCHQGIMDRLNKLPIVGVLVKGV
jgi:predicted heme/steroid binding protein